MENLTHRARLGFRTGTCCNFILIIGILESDLIEGHLKPWSSWLNFASKYRSSLNRIVATLLDELAFVLQNSTLGCSRGVDTV